MAEYIEKQAAIEALEELKELDYELYVRMGCCHLLEDDWDYVIRRYKEIIKETPSIQPKTGRWTLDRVSFLPEYVCTNCKSRFPLVASEGEFYSTLCCKNMNYCPKCGAKMEDEKNERDFV